jgi:hypothetical protein
MDYVYGRRCDSDHVDNAWDISMSVYVQETINKIEIKPFNLFGIKMLTVYLLWIFIHYCSTYSYEKLCVREELTNVISYDQQCRYLALIVDNEIGPFITLISAIVIIITCKILFVHVYNK